MSTQTVGENRSPYDTPLLELDCEVFYEFYFDFLGKTENDKLELLKAITLMRQGQRRAFVHSIMAARRLADTVFPTMEQRELLLTFPSTLPTVWSAMMDYKRDYRGVGSAPLAPIQDVVSQQLSQVEESREQLKVALKGARSIQPKEKLNLAIAFSGTGELKQQQRMNYKVLLVALASQPFLCVIPQDSAQSTQALGKLRTYINQMLTQLYGRIAESIHVEFFTVGGAYLKRDGRIEIAGFNPIFDVLFDNPDGPYSSKIINFYRSAKFTKIYEILSEEFPAEGFAWEEE